MTREILFPFLLCPPIKPGLISFSITCSVPNCLSKEEAWSCYVCVCFNYIKIIWPCYKNASFLIAPQPHHAVLYFCQHPCSMCLACLLSPYLLGKHRSCWGKKGSRPLMPHHPTINTNLCTYLHTFI